MIQDWLRRFRPAGVPGGPATAGVPLDKSALLESELRPVLARLAEAEGRTSAAEEQYEASAQQARDDAAASAHRLVAEARASAATERDRAIAEWRATAQSERENLLREARAEAELIRDQSARELPGMVAEAVALVLAGGSRRP
jgi:vacuolar-type H+-ATPase subunit H